MAEHRGFALCLGRVGDQPGVPVGCSCALQARRCGKALAVVQWAGHPAEPAVETLIELSHRLTSGLALLAVIALLIWARRAFPKGHGARWAAGWSMAFMVVEALVGAGLVLLEYTASNVSVARAYWMAGHLVNTFILLAFLALTAWLAAGNPHPGCAASALLVGCRFVGHAGSGRKRRGDRAG